jgi:hypothetical protein
MTIGLNPGYGATPSLPVSVLSGFKDTCDCSVTVTVVVTVTPSITPQTSTLAITATDFTAPVAESFVGIGSIMETPLSSYTSVSSNSPVSATADVPAPYDTPAPFYTALSSATDTLGTATFVSSNSGESATAPQPYGFIGASLCGTRTIPVSVVHGTTVFATATHGACLPDSTVLVPIPTAILTAGISQSATLANVTSPAPYGSNNSGNSTRALAPVSASTPFLITTSVGVVNNVRLALLVGFVGLSMIL